MNILLTGATGFIGSAFARCALAGGHRIGALASPGKELPASLATHPNLVWLRGTLQNAPWLEIENFRADVCVHSAWVTTPGVYLESPENLEFLDRSLTFLQQVESLGTRHIVALGTCIEYQPSREKLSEDTSPIAPATLYARCKNDLRLAMEARVRTSNGGLKLAWGRVFYPYGPGEHPSRLCSALIQKLRREEPIHLKTPRSTKDYIFIDDLAAAILKLVETKYSGSINLGTGIGISVQELAETLAQMLGKPELVQMAQPPQTDPLGDVIADAAKLRELGWRPEWSLKQGLEKLLDNFR